MYDVINVSMDTKDTSTGGVKQTHNHSHNNYHKHFIKIIVLIRISLLFSHCTQALQIPFKAYTFLLFPPKSCNYEANQHVFLTTLPWFTRLASTYPEPDL